MSNVEWLEKMRLRGVIISEIPSGKQPKAYLGTSVNIGQQRKRL